MSYKFRAEEFNIESNWDSTLRKTVLFNRYRRIVGSIDQTVVDIVNVLMRDELRPIVQDLIAEIDKEQFLDREQHQRK